MTDIVERLRFEADQWLTLMKERHGVELDRTQLLVTEAADEIERLRQRLSELDWCEDMEKAPRTWTPIELWSKRDGFAYTSWVGEPHNHWRDHFGARFTHWRLPIPPTSTGD